MKALIALVLLLCASTSFAAGGAFQIYNNKFSFPDGSEFSTAPKDGKTILNGSGAPIAPANPGDFYIDTTNKMLYGPYAASWPAGVSLIGPAGSAVAPLALAGAIDNAGVIRATNSSATGIGVSGISTAATGGSYGVYGSNASIVGAGVWGYASSATGSPYGVLGSSAGSSGVGVYGSAFAPTGSTTGVLGSSGSSSGRGVAGFASSLTGLTTGVYGSTDSTAGDGVAGYATATTGNGYGVTGITASPDGLGVYGYSSATTGSTSGVYGHTVSSTGSGVTGLADSATGSNYGVFGRSDSSGGVGTLGYTTSATGVTYGIWGYTASPDGFAGYFSGNVSIDGTFTATGAKSFVQPHPNDPSKEINYIAAEGPEAMVFIRGTARLEKGEYVIRLPEYFSLVASETGIGVQLTPRSRSSKGLAAYEVSKDRILVGELMDGTGSYEFDYYVTAKRAGFESHEPIQTNTHFSSNNLDPAEFEKRHSGDNTSNKNVRNLLIKNGTLNSDGKLNVETARRLDWKLDKKNRADSFLQRKR